MDDTKPFFDALGSQTSMITDVSAAGIGAIIFTWLRSYGVVGDESKLAQFRWPLFLIVPALGFAVAIWSGYSIVQLITGFFLEAMLGINQSTGESIHSLSQLFSTDYRSHIFALTKIQVRASMLSIFGVFLWYAINIIRVICVSRRQQRCR